MHSLCLQCSSLTLPHGECLLGRLFQFSLTISCFLLSISLFLRTHNCYSLYHIIYILCISVFLTRDCELENKNCVSFIFVWPLSNTVLGTFLKTVEKYLLSEVMNRHKIIVCWIADCIKEKKL